MVCELCGDTNLARCFFAFDFDGSVQPFEIRQCRQCGLAITVPKPANMDDYYSQTYYGSGQKKFSGVIEYLTQLGCKWRADSMLKHASALQQADRISFDSKSADGKLIGAKQSDVRPRVLDIGCGRAGLLRRLQQSGCDCYGTERASFPDTDELHNLQIFTGFLPEAGFKDGDFDVVSIWHVLEHLDDPFETLDEIARVTRRGGLLAVAVPNFSSWQCKLFKSAWFHLDLPRHLYHFDVRSLSQALTARGYSLTSTSTCSFEQNVYGFIQSLMNKLYFLGKPNEFYQLLKKRSGFKQHLKLIFWTVVAGLILPLALLEFALSCLFKKGASVIIFACKSTDTKS